MAWKPLRIDSGEAIAVSIHNMCFSDKIFFLKARFKVTQHWELLKGKKKKKKIGFYSVKIHGMETFKNRLGEKF